jgi:hypothetical protein
MVKGIMEEELPKKIPPVKSDKNFCSNKIEKRQDKNLHHKLAESRSSSSSTSKNAGENNKHAPAINGTGTTSELDDASEVHDGAIETEESTGFSDPHIPISTAKDAKTSFTKEQKKLIKELQREAKKLEKSIIKETDIARQNKQITRNISILIEKLVKARSEMKIYGIIDEIKTLHKRLKRGKLKFMKERNRIRKHDKMIDKIKSEIPI